MVGIIVISHGKMAEEAVKSAAMLVGESDTVASEGVYEGDSPDAVYERVSAAAARVDDGSGVVALVDIFGGTPNNTVFRLKRERNVRIVTGFNLPMLIYAVTERTPEMTQEEIVEGLLSIGAAQIREFGK